MGEKNLDTTEHAGTHLNICAILSQLGSHEDAIAMAKKAIDVLNCEDIKLATTEPLPSQDGDNAFSSNHTSVKSESLSE